MSRIRILSEQLANQIAAGEVVERPASVVKELVENSLDAGADRIDVYVEGSGSRLLRITDNGEGMDGDDVLLSLERHATSKIKDESQLAAIATLGFRGEAIPSIGSVSWMTIASRPAHQELGTRAEIRYGNLQTVHEHGCSRGTVIEIRHLFGNMPARKKFLKSARTEMHHIEEVIKNQALAHPHVGFTLYNESRVSLEYQPGSDLERRVREVFKYPGKLLPLEAQVSGPDEIALAGYLLLPETAPASSARLRILVNDRPVQDGMIRHAVSEGMQGFLMKGYQAAGALLLTIGPDQVDVNVHPSKREIRFRKSETVHRFIAATVRKALETHQERLRSSLFTSSSSAPPPAQSPEKQPSAQPVLPTSPTQTPVAPQLLSPQRTPSLKTAEPEPRQGAAHTSPPMDPPPRVVPIEPKEEPPPELPVTSESDEPVENTPVFTGLQLIGQLFQLYLLCEKDGELIVIDQHAAHERILYTQLLAGYQATRIPRQSLMFPATVELTPAQMDTMEAHEETVASLGLQAEYFGDSTFVIKAVPALIRQEDPKILLREVLDGLRGLRGAEAARPLPQVVDDLLASMACKAAIKAGNRLQPQEMLTLLAEMETSAVFSHCPHGRPVIKSFTTQEVERWFHRHGG
ncbi:DNA mismatch repair endonuclease MutL [Desulfobulbus rhabdoformis]|uniref:DNA mismatch repair endonuclease MutL n=1 Tax=Desulfobulbus rhabdoformis TaxID=34032 RepID=UPI001964423B|nr:DNA mismatch repair endonuclease MutL [Desulfobulbus rhabdoformis]